MFKNVRVQLMVMYPLVGLALVVLAGGGAYLLIRYYLMIEYYPDIELEARMAVEYHRLNLPLPEDLGGAEDTWERRQPGSQQTELAKEALVAVMFLDGDGQVIRSHGAAQIVALGDGVKGAQTRGRDLRTTRSPDGILARVLTYHLPDGAGGADYLQIRRVLSSQDLTITQLSIEVLGLGVFVAVLIALFSWWLAGRSLLPAQRAWEHQQQFIANASHELRTPITLIRANAEVAQRPGTREPRRMELLNDIVQECDHVSHLVEDLLLLSRLDARKLALSKEKIPVGDLLAEVQQQFLSLAGERGIALKLAACEGTVLADRTRLRQVLMILVDNALKFTPAGGEIQLGSSRLDKQVVIFVKDSGAGIPKQHLRHVFERFYQVEGQADTPESNPGSGLGLPIAKGLVEAQGGSIEIESEPGEGACLRVLLHMV